MSTAFSRNFNSDELNMNQLNNEFQTLSTNDNRFENEYKICNNFDRDYDVLINYGKCEEKGIRATMEDAMICEYNFKVTNSLCTSNTLSIFGIFDGHGGNECSTYCQQNFGLILRKMLKKYDDIYTVLNETVAILDKNFAKYEETIDESLQGSGSTLCVCIIDNKSHDAWVVNTGDSRCLRIFEKNNNKYGNKQLSIEHKPTIKNELIRIKNAGGFVSRGYLMNMLGVSRSIGDIPFKSYWKNILISKPDITHFKLNSNDKCILLACDGLFDVFNNKEITKFINNRITNISLNKLCQSICKHAINVRKSRDNVSVIVIKLDFMEKEQRALKIGRFTVTFESDYDNSEIDSGSDTDATIPTNSDAIHK